MKTMKDAVILLKSVEEAYNLEDIFQAAQHVLDNYTKWDHQGSDRLFLAYCEEITSDPTRN